jgi:hypothetical protein
VAASHSTQALWEVEPIGAEHRGQPDGGIEARFGQHLSQLRDDHAQRRGPRRGHPLATHAQVAINEQTTKQLQVSIDLARPRQHRAIAARVLVATSPPALQLSPPDPLVPDSREGI